MKSSICCIVEFLQDPSVLAVPANGFATHVEVEEAERTVGVSDVGHPYVIVTPGQMAQRVSKQRGWGKGRRGRREEESVWAEDREPGQMAHQVQPERGKEG